MATHPASEVKQRHRAVKRRNFTDGAGGSGGGTTRRQGFAPHLLLDMERAAPA